MNEHHANGDRAFDTISQASRVGRTARMMDERESLKKNQREDIAERFKRFIEDNDITQNQAAREIGISSTTISEVVRMRYTGKTADAHLIRIHNWMELTARRDSIVRSRTFVETSVAQEILLVAQTVAETCKMGVVFGPAQIGKSFTLAAIEGDQRFGDPVVIRVDESLRRPLPLCRTLCTRFELSANGTFDTLMRRIVRRLAGTKRMLIFDEAERLVYQSLETVRDLHDETGCPMLFAGKPAIYERLGFRQLGDFNEVTDQLASRIVMKRDLTERTRGDKPAPLFSIADIQKLITQSSLTLRVSQGAQEWLRDRASTLGMGGLGKALVSLYLAFKVAFANGDSAITVGHLEQVDELVIGNEDAGRVAEAVAESAGMRRVV